MAKIMAFVQTPRDLAGILQNIKTALDHGLLIDDDFYSGDVLKHYLGGRGVRWLPVTRATLKSGSIYDFGRLVEPMPVGAAHVDGLTVTFRVAEVEGRRLANLAVSVMDQKAADFEAVEALFGSDWKLLPPRDRIHPDLRLPTRPHGSEAISYSSGNRMPSWTITFEFSPDAAVRDVYIEMKGLKRHD